MLEIAHLSEPERERFGEVIKRLITAGYRIQVMRDGGSGCAESWERNDSHINFYWRDFSKGRISEYNSTSQMVVEWQKERSFIEHVSFDDFMTEFGITTAPPVLPGRPNAQNGQNAIEAYRNNIF